MTTVIKKQTLAARVIAHLKGGDDAKVSRFEIKLGKYVKEQIAIRDREIGVLQDKITDAQDAFEEAVPNINLESIAKADSLEVYVAQYVTGLNTKLEAVEDLEAKVEALEAEKNRFNTLLTAIYGEDEIETSINTVKG